MKAVRVGSNGQIEVAEVETPRVGPGEALLRVHASGICGSDLLSWYVRQKAGQVLGHELAGELVAIGDGVTAFAPGDRVVPHHHAACLACATCSSGRYVHCPEWKASALDPGGMAEFVRIPAGNLARDTRRIPSHLTDEEATFTEPLATVLKAFRRSGFQSGQSLLVVGLGPMGQLALRLGVAQGAVGMVGADRVASRLRTAQSSGASDTIDVTRETLADGARRATAGLGFDLVFVAPGRVRVIQEALETVARGGTLLLFTMAPPEETLSITPHDLYFREVNLIPSYSCGPDDMFTALELLSAGVVPVADLISHRFSLAEAREAFARASDPRDTMKVVFRAGADLQMPVASRGT